VFTPADAPHAKVAAIRRHGAELRAEGRDYERMPNARDRVRVRDRRGVISPYNDADVIAGAATIALEIVEELRAPTR